MIWSMLFRDINSSYENPILSNDVLFLNIIQGTTVVTEQINELGLLSFTTKQCGYM